MQGLGLQGVFQGFGAYERRICAFAKERGYSMCA